MTKPAHLGPQYAAQFEDASIAEAYHTRPPYPSALFDTLVGLMPLRSRVLELGCGTGDIALGLAGRVEHVDALDPSAAMLRVARGRPGFSSETSGADRANIHWIGQSAESFQPAKAYALVVAAESFHWMEWPVVCGWLQRALVPDAFLALVTGRSFDRLPWDAEIGRLVARYSTNREFRPYDLVHELTQRGLFVEAGRASTPALPFVQSIDDYVESWHTRNGLSRERMGHGEAEAFDRGVRDAVASYGTIDVIRGSVGATVVWGTPAVP